MEARWHTGIWIGKSVTTGEHLIWAIDGSGVKSSRSIHLQDEATRIETVQGITEGPNEVCSRMGPRQPVRRPGLQPASEPGRSIRKWQITRELFHEYGAIPECPKCLDWSQNRRSHRGHSQACRNRLERTLRSHPVFGPRMQRSNARAQPRVPDAVPDAVPVPPVRPESPEPAEEVAEPIEDVAMEPTVEDAEMLQVEFDPNTDSVDEDAFSRDLLADEWEANQMTGVTPEQAVEAKKACAHKTTEFIRKRSAFRHLVDAEIQGSVM